MSFIIGGGRQSHVVETYMIKDKDGYIVTSKSYVRGHPELFKYIGHVRINSTIVHTFEFITAP